MLANEAVDATSGECPEDLELEPSDSAGARQALDATRVPGETCETQARPGVLIRSAVRLSVLSVQ